VVGQDLHAGEEFLEMGRDEVLEGKVAEPPGAVCGQLGEPRQVRRHLDARELLAVALRVPHAHREVERESGDVREGVSRVHRERHKHGEYPGGEEFADSRPVVRAEFVPALDPDAGLVEGGPDMVAQYVRVTLLQLVRLLADVGQDIARSAPHIGRHRDAGGDPSFEAGDSHHEELIEVRCEDREEVHPLEQRHRRILREFKDPLIEGQPAELAIEETIPGHAPVIYPGRLSLIVVEEVGSQSRVAERALVHAPYLVTAG